MDKSILFKHLSGSLGGLGYELRVRYLPQAPVHAWTPSINAFLCHDQMIVCVELAGVAQDQIEVHVEPRRLLVRGVRQPLECAENEGPPLQVFALEIDQGLFQREIALPCEVRSDGVRAEQRNGMLWIYLPLVG
ncbi:MAG TPA: Hsp20/alpha crystallin family protein [Chthoniobacter sp.]|jgi:HSP20 family protein